MGKISYNWLKAGKDVSLSITATWDKDKSLGSNDNTWAVL